MVIVAIAWLYVALMMAITETSVVAGVMTLLFYGVIPVAILWYLAGSRARRARRAALDGKAVIQTPKTGDSADPDH